MEKFLRSNHFAKGLALFLAVALWLFVIGDSITRTTPSRKHIEGVPLVYENLETGLVVTSLPTIVSVTLEGLPEAFDGLMIDELEAYVDLAEKEPGLYRLRVRGKPPRGLTLVVFTPDEVEVVIEPLQAASYNVYAEFYGTPADGWSRQSFSYEPMQVRAEAPQSVLEQISRVVLRIDQSGMREENRGELAPLILDMEGNELTGVSLIPEKISFMINLVKNEDNGS